MEKYPDVIPLVGKETWDNVYKPDVDSYLLMNVLEKERDFINSHEPMTSLEIGVGSGIVSKYVKELFPRITTFCSDINPYALECTKKVHKEGNLIESSLIESIRDESIDLFIYNPPYVPTPEEELHHSYLSLSWAGGKDGREKIDCVIEHLWDILSPRGIGYIVIIQDNDPKAIIEMAVKHNLRPKIIDSIILETEKLYVLRLIPIFEINE
ncbi:n6-DNA-methyltransferase, putative [Entamoeba dispar SAW760]|uniref:N6-DNA-methyltransferase, putative n=1 Tax=Entamoeba dispar (strain ATCC PRA-260 / SAW760) TaxID=370354 RepID=B0EFI6_ENTDS|nr:n6-DNA-methyltransferase, putative [Entamoeba dispar SAW760]EDR26715.1 n6-DNA-methyltransferase, putative [Entamoeba dispar SAW760]|eukprot:EDR26715.1 n6-DNA-methyltransferase, putative [Entamoeba dispar SAW760]